MKKRSPSIHVNRETIIKVIKKLGKIDESNIDEVFLLCRRESLDHRSVMVDTMVAKKTIDVRTNSSLGDANLLATVIYSVRVKLKHIGVQKIKQSDSSWGQLKQIVPSINDFCDTFSLEHREGYIDFISNAIELFQKKSSNKNYRFFPAWILSNMDSIIEIYQAKDEISQDSNPKYTLEVYEIYQSLVLSMTGFTSNYKENPQEYVHFVRCKDFIFKVNVDPEDFIMAQFEALEFCNGIPQLKDLYGDKAQQRLVQYASKHNLSIRKEVKISDSIWDSFKK